MAKFEPLTPYIEDYSGILGGLPGQSNPSVAACRAAGIEMYKKEGLPVKGVEAWKYTRLHDLEGGSFHLCNADTIEPQHQYPDLFPHAGIKGDVIRVVMVDGFYDASRSSTPQIGGLKICSLKSCLLAGNEQIISKVDKNAAAKETPLAALSSAYLNDGVVIQLDAGVEVEQVIEVVSLSSDKATPILTFPRVVITLGDGASATVVESHHGLSNGAYASNTVTDIDLSPNSFLKHYVLQSQSLNATHVFTGRCNVPEDASYRSFVLQLGGKTARHEMYVSLTGENGRALLNGAYGARGDAHCDVTTIIDHISPSTNSDQVFKGILDDTAKGVFQGRVHVHRGAQQMNGNQLHNAMLLSRKAKSNCKPELEIYADDVKCSHGATVGELDADQLFFLRSRGIDEMSARAMLVNAFLRDVLYTITADNVRDAFLARAHTWFAAGQKG